MTRAELRLELIRIAHHQGQSHDVTLTIAKHYEAAFADLSSELGAPPASDSEAPAPAAKRGKAA